MRRSNKRKNFLATLVLSLCLWGVLGSMVVYVEPELVKDVLIPGVYLPFFMLFFPASFLTLSLLLGNSRRGLLTALGLTIFLILRLFQVGNWLNGLLLIGIILAVDKYWSK